MTISRAERQGTSRKPARPPVAAARPRSESPIASGSLTGRVPPELWAEIIAAGGDEEEMSGGHDWDTTAIPVSAEAQLGPGISEFFVVGKIVAPEGVGAALKAVRAFLAGDHAATLRHAQEAMRADRYANAKREARTPSGAIRRGNVIGNAWSGFFEAITGRPSGWSED